MAIGKNFKDAFFCRSGDFILKLPPCVTEGVTALLVFLKSTMNDFRLSEGCTFALNST